MGWGGVVWEEGRRLLGVGVGCCAHQPQGAGPGGPPQPRIPPLCKSKPFPPHKAATQIALDAKQIVVTIGQAATLAQPSPGALPEPSALAVLARNRAWARDCIFSSRRPKTSRRCLAGGASCGQSYALALGQ